MGRSLSVGNEIEGEGNIANGIAAVIISDVIHDVITFATAPKPSTEPEILRELTDGWKPSAYTATAEVHDFAQPVSTRLFQYLKWMPLNLELLSRPESEDLMIGLITGTITVDKVVQQINNTTLQERRDLLLNVLKVKMTASPELIQQFAPSHSTVSSVAFQCGSSTIHDPLQNRMLQQQQQSVKATSEMDTAKAVEKTSRENGTKESTGQGQHRKLLQDEQTKDGHVNFSFDVIDDQLFIACESYEDLEKLDAVDKCVNFGPTLQNIGDFYCPPASGSIGELRIEGDGEIIVPKSGFKNIPETGLEHVMRDLRRELDEHFLMSPIMGEGKLTDHLQVGILDSRRVENRDRDITAKAIEVQGEMAESRQVDEVKKEEPVVLDASVKEEEKQPAGGSQETNSQESLSLCEDGETESSTPEQVEVGSSDFATMEPWVATIVVGARPDTLECGEDALMNKTQQSCRRNLPKKQQAQDTSEFSFAGLDPRLLSTSPRAGLGAMPVYNLGNHGVLGGDVGANGGSNYDQSEPTIMTILESLSCQSVDELPAGERCREWGENEPEEFSRSMLSNDEYLNDLSGLLSHDDHFTNLDELLSLNKYFNYDQSQETCGVIKLMSEMIDSTVDNHKENSVADANEDDKDGSDITDLLQTDNELQKMLNGTAESFDDMTEILETESNGTANEFKSNLVSDMSVIDSETCEELLNVMIFDVSNENESSLSPLKVKNSNDSQQKGEKNKHPICNDDNEEEIKYDASKKNVPSLSPQKEKHPVCTDNDKEELKDVEEIDLGKRRVVKKMCHLTPPIKSKYECIREQNIAEREAKFKSLGIEESRREVAEDCYSHKSKKSDGKMKSKPKKLVEVGDVRKSARERKAVNYRETKQTKKHRELDDDPSWEPRGKIKKEKREASEKSGDRAWNPLWHHIHNPFQKKELDNTSTEALRRPLRKKKPRKQTVVDEPHADEFLFCENCGKPKLNGCELHPPIFNYIATVDIAPSRAGKNAGRGVFNAGGPIPEGVMFGPYHGEFYTVKEYNLLKKTKGESGYAWAKRDPDQLQVIGYVDPGPDPDPSQWMSLVNCAPKIRQQNVIQRQYKGEIYYQSLDVIQEGEEILVYYGDSYAKVLNINVAERDFFEMPENWEEAGVKCSHCGTGFVKPDLLKNHIDMAAVGGEGACVVLMQAQKKLEISAGVRVHVCGDCGKGFKSRSTLNEHKNTHNSNRARPFACSECDKTYFDSSSLKKHIRIHHSDEDNSFPCPDCDKRFVSKQGMTVHLKSCRQEAPEYKCDQCGKKYNRKDSLKKHINAVHYQMFRYKCTTCEKRFGRLSILSDHIKIVHNGERLHTCEHCAATFKQGTALVKHKANNHTFQFKCFCEVCKKKGSYRGFVYPSDLKKHMLACHPTEYKKQMERDNPAACPKCHKRFPDQKQVTVHLEKIHGVPNLNQT